MQLISNINENFVEILNSDSTIDCYEVERGKLTNSVSNQISELSRGTNCLYFLIDEREPKVDTFKRHLYVGETTNIYNRIIDHDRKKDWWTHVIIFTGDKRKFDETTICALEHLLIDLFKISDRYDLCNSQSSKKDVAGDYDTKVQYILFVMDYLGYSLEKNAIVKNPDEKQEKQQNDFYNSVDNFLNSLGLEIKYDQMKLYRSYYLFKEHKKVPLFALWPNREAEVYLDYTELNEIVPTAYDTSNRIRGNRKSAYKLKTENDVRLLEKLINKIIQ